MRSIDANIASGFNRALFDVEASIMHEPLENAVTLVIDGDGHAEVIDRFVGTKRGVRVDNSYDRLMKCYENGDRYLITHNHPYVMGIAPMGGISYRDMLMGFTFKGKREVRAVRPDGSVAVISYGIIPESVFIKVVKLLRWYRRFILCICLLELFIIALLLMYHDSYQALAAFIFSIPVLFISIIPIIFPPQAIKFIYRRSGYGDYVIYGNARIGERLPEPKSVPKELGVVPSSIKN